MTDLATIRNALTTWVTAKTGITWLWSDSDYPAPSYPYGVLNIVAGPRAIGWSDEIRATTEAGVVADVTITPQPANEAIYSVDIGNDAFIFESDADATAAEICAGLAAEINDLDTGSPIATATDNEDGTFELTHNEPGETFTLALSDNLTYANNDAGHEVALEIGGQREITISLNVFSSDKSPSGDARFHLLKLFEAANLPSSIAVFDAAGFALIERLPVVSLNDTTNGKRRSRAAFDIIVRYAASTIERTGYIETVAISSDTGFADELDDEIIGAA